MNTPRNSSQSVDLGARVPRGLPEQDLTPRWPSRSAARSTLSASPAELEAASARGDAPIRTIVCDPDPMARRLVRGALEATGITVIGEARDRRETTQLALHYRPEVVVIGAGQEGDSIRCTREIRRGAPEVRILILSTSNDMSFGIKSLRAGATGYVSKDVDPDELSRHVTRVARGEPVVSPALFSFVLDYIRAFPEEGLGIRPVRSALTGREWEVLDALSAGYDMEEIAGRLVISLDTVRSHVKSILRKLSVHSRGEAIERARSIRIPKNSEDPVT